MPLKSITPELRDRLLKLSEHHRVGADKLLECAIELGVKQLESKWLLDSGKFAKISKKQQMVLHHLKLGKSVKEIAFEMSMSENTVRSHITRLKEKLACQDLLELRMR